MLASSINFATLMDCLVLHCIAMRLNFHQPRPLSRLTRRDAHIAMPSQHFEQPLNCINTIVPKSHNMT